MFILIFITVGFFIDTVLFWYISHHFHWISFSSISSLLITALLYPIISLFLSILFRYNVIVRIPLEILGLWLLSKVVSGFHIAGFWQLITTYIFFLVVNFIGGVLIEEADKSKF
jgi:uncharacterized membrane protein YvlD (DUF360 family)